MNIRRWGWGFVYFREQGIDVGIANWGRTVSECGENLFEKGKSGVERRGSGWEWKGEGLDGWMLRGKERREYVEKVGVEGFESGKLF